MSSEITGSLVNSTGLPGDNQSPNDSLVSRLCNSRYHQSVAGSRRKSNQSPKPRFILTLEVQHRHDDADGMRRLRAILKLLVRSFGFQCKGIERPGWQATGEESVTKSS